MISLFMEENLLISGSWQRIYQKVNSLESHKSKVAPPKIHPYAVSRERIEAKMNLVFSSSLMATQE